MKTERCGNGRNTADRLPVVDTGCPGLPAIARNLECIIQQCQKLRLFRELWSEQDGVNGALVAAYLNGLPILSTVVRHKQTMFSCPGNNGAIPGECW